MAVLIAAMQRLCKFINNCFFGDYRHYLAIKLNNLYVRDTGINFTK